MKPEVTLEQVRDAKPALCFYSSRTVFWTHDPKDLNTTGQIPLDPFGCPLYETDRVKDFIDVERIRGHRGYGEHSLTTYTWSHGRNLKKLLELPDSLKYFPKGEAVNFERYYNFGKIITQMVTDKVLENLDVLT